MNKIKEMTKETRRPAIAIKLLNRLLRSVARAIIKQAINGANNTIQAMFKFAMLLFQKTKNRNQKKGDYLLSDF
jgi:hypothetical protein